MLTIKLKFIVTGNTTSRKYPRDKGRNKNSGVVSIYKKPLASAILVIFNRHCVRLESSKYL